MQRVCGMSALLCACSSLQPSSLRAPGDAGLRTAQQWVIYERDCSVNALLCLTGA